MVGFKLWGWREKKIPHPPLLARFNLKAEKGKKTPESKSTADFRVNIQETTLQSSPRLRLLHTSSCLHFNLCRYPAVISICFGRARVISALGAEAGWGSRTPPHRAADEAVALDLKSPENQVSNVKYLWLTLLKENKKCCNSLSEPQFLLGTNHSLSEVVSNINAKYWEKLANAFSPTHRDF